MVFVFVFFKQKTAYEMRISDWSSDVCSSDLADVGVVAARADVEQQLLAGIVEHRRDHRDVRQVGAAVVGGVQRVDVTRPHGRPVLADHRLDRLAHGAEMHRHVRRVGDQVAVGVEDGAGRSEEHTSELQSLMRISYAVFCLKKKNQTSTDTIIYTNTI